MLVLTDALPGLDVRLVDGVIRDAGLLAAVPTATARTVSQSQSQSVFLTKQKPRYGQAASTGETSAPIPATIP
jgi:hypothetical protein